MFKLPVDVEKIMGLLERLVKAVESAVAEPISVDELRMFIEDEDCLWDTPEDMASGIIGRFDVRRRN